MRFTLLVLSPPDLGVSNGHALDFARAALEAGHELACVFFQDAGVLTGGRGYEPPQAERDLRTAWSDLGERHGTPLVLCSASALRYGVATDAGGAALREGFSIHGLGDLIEANASSDRLLTFGD
jgi:tRNA 2-thiouridine synthesizing protein D